MIRRLFYLSVGAGIGAYVVLRAKRLARLLTPQHIAVAATTRAARSLGSFARDVRDASAARERELRRDLGLEGGPQIIPHAVEAPRSMRSIAAPGRGRSHRTNVNHEIDGDGH